MSFQTIPLAKETLSTAEPFVTIHPDGRVYIGQAVRQQLESLGHRELEFQFDAVDRALRFRGLVNGGAKLRYNTTKIPKGYTPDFTYYPRIGKHRNQRWLVEFREGWWYLAESLSLRR